MGDPRARPSGELRPPEPPLDPLEFLSRSWSASGRALGPPPPTPPPAALVSPIAEDAACELDDGGAFPPANSAAAGGSSFTFASVATSQLIKERILAQSVSLFLLPSALLLLQIAIPSYWKKTIFWMWPEIFISVRGKIWIPETWQNIDVGFGPFLFQISTVFSWLRYTADWLVPSFSCTRFCDDPPFLYIVWELLKLLPNRDIVFWFNCNQLCFPFDPMLGQGDTAKGEIFLPRVKKKKSNPQLFS
jgi:hypothetical protein